MTITLRCPPPLSCECRNLLFWSFYRMEIQGHAVSSFSLITILKWMDNFLLCNLNELVRNIWFKRLYSYHRDQVNTAKLCHQPISEVPQIESVQRQIVFFLKLGKRRYFLLVYSFGKSTKAKVVKHIAATKLSLKWENPKYQTSVTFLSSPRSQELEPNQTWQLGANMKTEAADVFSSIGICCLFNASLFASPSPVGTFYQLPVRCGPLC